MQGILSNRTIFGLILLCFMAQVRDTYGRDLPQNKLENKPQKQPKKTKYDSLHEQFHEAQTLIQQIPILTDLSRLPTSTKDSLNAHKKFQKYAQFSFKKINQLPDNDLDNKHILYQNAGRFYQKFFFYDSAMLMFDKANAIAYKQNDSIRVQYGLTDMAHYAKSAGKTADAEKLYRHALKIAKQYQNEADITALEECLGDVYVIFGVYDQAVAYYDSALVFRKTSKSNELVLLQNRIGELYLRWNQDTTAHHILKQALALAIQNKYELGEAYALRNLGKLHEKWHQNDSALVKYERAYAIFHKFHQNKEEILCHIYRGNIYIKTQEFDRADLFFRYAIQQAGHTNKRYLEAKAYEGETRNFMAKKKYARAMRASQFGQKIAKDGGYMDIIRDNLLNMSKIYEHNGNYEAALEHYQDYIATKDKIFNETNASKLAGMRASVEVSQAQDENKALKIRQKLQEKQLTTIGLALIFALLFTVGLVYILRQRNQVLKTLQTQNRQIDNQYKIIAKEKQKTDTAYHKLQLSQAQLLHSEKMASLGQLTAGVAHEFNNPINFVYSASETLEADLRQLIKIYQQQYDLENITDDKTYNEKLQVLNQLKSDALFEELPNDIFEALEDIRYGSERLSEIVQGLRTFSRLDQNTPKFIDIHENLNATLTILKNTLQTIEIQRNYTENLPLIECIPGEINQVFLNILTNAIQAIPDTDKGRIQISTSYDSLQNQLKITITDNGIGMPEIVSTRAFEPFFTTREVGQGTGVGLFTAHQIINRHGGTIEVQSQPNQGATFTIYLPTKHIEK